MKQNDPAEREARENLALGSVHRGRLYEQVLKQIQAMIAAGQLKPGDKLPPERELARRFEVSRSSVQHAIRALQLSGVVRSRQGGGTTICELPAQSLLDPLSSALARSEQVVAELLEVRKMLEPPVAASAALRASADEIARLEQLLQRQEEKIARGELIIQEDSDFHYAIAMASRNSVVRKIVDLLMEQLRESRARGMQVPGRAEKSFAGHRRILSAIRRRDPHAANVAMLRHIREIEVVIATAQEGGSTPSGG